MVKKSKVYPSRKLDQFVIRMPNGLRERLVGQANRNKRSTNAEIINILQNSLERNLIIAGTDEGHVGLRDQLARSMEIIMFQSSKAQSLLQQLENANWKTDDK